MKVSQQDITAAREALKSGGKSATGVSPQWLQKRCGFDYDTAKAVLEELKKPEPPPPPPPEQREFEGDRQTFTGYSKERITTLAQLLAFCQVDPAEWEVERYVVNKWEVGAKNAAQQIEVEPLFQVKAWLKRKVALTQAREEIEALLDELTKRAPVYPVVKSSTQSGNMLELSIPDIHWGKLAWAEETGWTNYDGKIADRDFRTAYMALLERTRPFKFDRVLVVPGNDMLHSNNNKNETAGGTPMDCDGRHHKMFRLACKTTIWTIEEALKIAPRVDVLPIPGNHDPDVVLYLSVVLEAHFRNCKRVHIDIAPTTRKFYQWGDVGLMFTHKGGKGKDKTHRNRMLMATERRKMWGNTKFNEIHTGDLHQVRLEEEFGVRVRILPSLVPPDAWHAENTFVGMVRSAEAYVWNKKEGLISTAHYNIAPPDMG